MFNILTYAYYIYNTNYTHNLLVIALIYIMIMLFYFKLVIIKQLNICMISRTNNLIIYTISLYIIDTIQI